MQIIHHYAQFIHVHVVEVIHRVSEMQFKHIQQFFLTSKFKCIIFFNEIEYHFLLDSE